MNAGKIINSIHYKLAEKYTSVKVMGPPMSQKLIDVITHLYTEEEAILCSQMSFFYPKSIKDLCKRSPYNPKKTNSLLEQMYQKRKIIKLHDRFMLYPLIPGAFERILMTGENTPWHKKFALLINDLFDTDYLQDYFSKPINAIRNIPVQQIVEKNSFAVNSDLISELIESHKHFGVCNSCACRQSMEMSGRSCSRASAEDGCLGFGEYTSKLEEYGNGRSVSKSEMYDIVAERWDKNLVFLTSNVQPSLPNAICTCCECCCHGLAIQNKYKGNLVAPSHFIINIDRKLCTNCGSCAKACNTEALKFYGKKLSYLPENCIGCGNCIKYCRENCITMTQNQLYKKPKNKYSNLILQMLPQIISMGSKIKLKRIFK